jgi:SAM-dependent methyltransferase
MLCRVQFHFRERAVLKIIKKVARQYINRKTEREWHHSSRRDYSDLNERPIEYSFALRRLSNIAPKSVLDVGSGKSSWPHLLSTCGYSVAAIDNVKDFWVGDCWNRHWHITEDSILAPTLTQKFDVITCISVLEHIGEHQCAMQNMFSLLSPDGHIILTGPFRAKEYHPNVYDDPRCEYYGARGLCQMYSHTELEDWTTKNEATLVTSEYYDLFAGEIWREGARLKPPVLSGPGPETPVGVF